MKFEVFKFGGASVKSSDAVRNIAQVLGNYQDKNLVVVLSAMDKTTNKLEEVLSMAFEGNKQLNAKIEELKDFHYQITIDLIGDDSHPVFNDIENLFIELQCLLDNIEDNAVYDVIYDQIIPFGELLSTKIVSAFLLSQKIKTKWTDIRNFIRTDNMHREAKINWDFTEINLRRYLMPMAEKSLIVTQGFIGRSMEHKTTTLGREGSDYTAAILAWCMEADAVTIWKDVPGIMNADPKKVESAELIKKISYNECIELAYYGASVIHPKTIQPLKNKKIPLYVRSFLDFENEGTVVCESKEPLVSKTCLIHKSNQSLISISVKDFSFIVEQHLVEIFEILAKHRIRLNLMQNSAISLSFCTDTKKQKDILEILKLELGDNYNITVEGNLNLLTIYGEVNSENKPNGPFMLVQKNAKTSHFVY